MSIVKEQGILPAEFLVSEGNGQISREQIVVKAGPALPAGQVLGVTNTGEYAPYDTTRPRTARRSQVRCSTRRWRRPRSRDRRPALSGSPRSWAAC